MGVDFVLRQGLGEMTMILMTALMVFRAQDI